MIDLDELKLANALIKSDFKRIYDWAIGDIRKCCRIKNDGSYKKGAGALVGAFILWCCALDYYGGLLVGVKKYRNWDGKLKKENFSSKIHIAAFVKNYLKKYDKYDNEKLYALRCALVHNYTLAGYDVIEHDPNQKKYHLVQTKKGLLLHLGSSLEDLEKAAKDYIRDVKKNNQLKINAFEYYTLNPMLKPMKMEDLNQI